jgi:hypothetical protein
MVKLSVIEKGSQTVYYLEKMMGIEMALVMESQKVYLKES